MGHINWTRVILGGLFGGVVINVFEFVLNAVVLRNDWASAMRALGKPEQLGAGQVAAFLIWGFLVGIFAVWFYAEIRPQYGAGPRTAVIAGLAIWFLGYLLASAAPLIMGLFPTRLMLIGLAVGLLEAVVGTIAGAWLYRDERAPASSVTAPRPVT